MGGHTSQGSDSASPTAASDGDTMSSKATIWLSMTRQARRDAAGFDLVAIVAAEARAAHVIGCEAASANGEMTAGGAKGRSQCIRRSASSDLRIVVSP